MNALRFDAIDVTGRDVQIRGAEVVKLSYEFMFNCMIVIESIPDGEQHNGLRLVEDNALSWLRPTYVAVQSACELIRELGTIADEARMYGLVPILHIEAHGDKDGGLTLANDDIVSWATLSSHLRLINHFTCNNLTVCISCCNGFFVVQEVSVAKLTPYCNLIAPPDVVKAQQLLDDYIAFYLGLRTCGDVSAATKLTRDLCAYNCEQMLVDFYARLMKERRTQSQRRARDEKILTMAMLQDESMGVGEARKKVKWMLRPSRERFERHKTLFLGDYGAANSARFTATFEHVRTKAALRPG